MNSIFPEHRRRDILGSTARFVLYATTAAPLVVFPGFFFPYVTTRAIYFRVLVEFSIAILLYLVLRREVTLDLRRDFALWALLGWVASNALAAVFGVAPMRSLFGDHERMGGVWFWAHMLGFYVALRSLMRDTDWRIFFRIAVVIAAGIATYGLVQSWLRPFADGIGGVEAGATIGNGGLLAAYLLVNVFICGLIAARSRTYARLLCGAVAILLIVAVGFSGNRSSTLALGLGTAVATLAYLVWTKSLRGWRIIVVVSLAGSVIALPLLTRAPWARPVTSRVPALSRLSAGIDSSRVIQWRAAVEGIRRRPLLGFGPENYGIVWSSYYHPEMYRFLTDSPWDRAHNAYLEAFATAGMLGFLSLLAVFLAMTWSVNASVRQASEPLGPVGAPNRPVTEAVALGLIGAYAFYLFFWFFDINSTMLWVAVGAFISSRTAGPLISVGGLREKRWQTSVVLAFGAAAFVAVVYVHGFETLRMARTLDRLRAPNRAPMRVLEDYESVFGSPAPVTHHVFLMYASHLTSLRPTFDQLRKNAVGSALFDRAFVLAVEEFERQAVRDPLNERIIVQHARVLMLGANYYGNMRLYESALRRLQRAVEVAPRRVPTRLALGIAYLNIERSRDALAEFQKAYALYPPLGQTQAYLGLAYASLNQSQEAVRWLTGALDAGYALDPSIMTRVARDVAASGEPALAAKVTHRYLTKKYGPAFMWGHPSDAGNAADYTLALMAADFFERSGDTTSARVVQSAAEALCVRATPMGDLATSVLQRRSLAPPDCRGQWRDKVHN